MFLTIKLCSHAKLNCFKIKMDLALNNLQRFICYQTQQTKPNQTKLDVIFLQNTLLSIQGIFTEVLSVRSTCELFILIWCEAAASF